MYKHKITIINWIGTSNSSNSNKKKCDVSKKKAFMIRSNLVLRNWNWIRNYPIKNEFEFESTMASFRTQPICIPKFELTHSVKLLIQSAKMA